VEVNFMDDVGQTLLNWASAFGTQEMVEFLCAKGKLSVPGPKP
jgi:E3 ubiquitin-protein ligase HECTD1